VPALRSDWSVDPFKLTEQDGYFYGRGSSDDKYMAASFVANLIRYKKEGYKPDRDIILALETDEEIFDHDALGIQWLIRNHRELIDAEFALNEGGPVNLRDGKAVRVNIQTSEKVPVTFQLEVKNAGGHSSVPRKDNAIYRLAEGLVRLSKFEFPLHLTETTRAWFSRSAEFESEPTASNMRGALADNRMRWRSPNSRPSRHTMLSSAPPALPPCCKAVMPRTRCRNRPSPRSTAGSSRASRPTR
jgi:acetylornithine deacetylase/succinyl-diaminopimelate desuccinylase-like protein